MKGDSPKPGIEEVLRLVVEDTAAETGKEFFRALVRNLAQTLGTTGAWVTEYFPESKRMNALAMWMNNSFVEHFEYSVVGTACADVVESGRLIHIPDRVIELYSRDDGLIPLNAVSYLGAPLLDTDGSVMGNVAVLDDKPMPRDERAIAHFQMFAARATSEHRRLKMEHEVRAREEQLSALLETAMDAIVVLDPQLRVRL